MEIKTPDTRKDFHEKNILEFFVAKEAICTVVDGIGVWRRVPFETQIDALFDKRELVLYK